MSHAPSPPSSLGCKTMAEKLHKTDKAAIGAAQKTGCPNAIFGAVKDPEATGWVGVVYLRPDQDWMKKQVEERGCRAMRKT